MQDSLTSHGDWLKSCGVVCVLPVAVASQFGCPARALGAGLSAGSNSSWMVSAPGLGTGPVLLWGRIWTSEGRRQ